MTIDQIKHQLTLAQVLNYYHLKPDKNLRLNCPFHEDKTPSLQLYYKTQTCFCFSSNCKTHGKAMDVIDFIMNMEGLHTSTSSAQAKHEAILKAKQMITGEIKHIKPMDQLTRAAVITKMFTYFKNGVSSSKPAKEYIESRCLDYTKTEVGYNSEQFHHGKRKDEALIKSCIKYGILLDLGTKARTGNPAYKPFGKWGIVFPLRNEKGQIVSLYFRSTLKNKNQRHFYLRDRQGLYPKYPPAETKKLILTESIIDAASLMEQQKIKNKYEILSLYGTNGLTAEHTEAVSRLKQLDEIIFFLNGDPPGIKAVEKYAPLLKGMLQNASTERSRSIKITSVEVPDNEDVNSLLQSHSPEVLNHLIDTRKEHELIFSIENKEAVRSEEVEIPQIQEVKTTQPTKQAKGLDTTNPYNLKYSSSIASYQIKGFRMSQPDSLKITLNIATK